MSDISTTAKVTLSVNGEQAKKMIDDLKTGLDGARKRLVREYFILRIDVLLNTYNNFHKEVNKDFGHYFFSECDELKWMLFD